ncbi:hypothetical protein TNCT_94021 [Trichonephila clavata]|uniref:Uncharacterized protein n=1 Tax=Trichonephila clavata TaxID=2740835 RepID=A0A8X6KLM8_TRICU|nr:hypothetical protein TNCT_94021 [Trichonephila clavata]
MPSTCAAEQKMHPSTQQNSGLKLSMNILRTLTSNTGFHTTRRSLRPLVSVRIALGNNTERKVLFLPPPFSPPRGFRFPAVQQTPCLFRLQSMLQTCQWTSKTFQDAMDPLRNKETVQGRSFEKVLILKQATS